MQRREAFRTGIIGMIEALEPQFAVTLAVNRTIALDHGGVPQRSRDGRQCVLDWHARLDRELLGGRWKSPRMAGQRTKGFFLPEHPGTNLHYHGVLKVHPDRVAKFEEALMEMSDAQSGEVYGASPIWRSIVPSGTSAIKRLSRGGSSGWGGYMTKKNDDQDSLIVLPN